MGRGVKVDSLQVRIYDTRAEMGQAAAAGSAGVLRDLLMNKNEINCVFAAAPSQNEVLAALVQMPDIPWERVNAFHMDEYVGLNQDHPASFAHFLKEAVFQKLPFRRVNLIHGENDPAEECRRYGELLEQYPPDFVFMGIGENGHIAFNDPDVADFHDGARIKQVQLDQICRMQQVHDGCFPNLEAVPTQALTVTIPVLCSASAICCVVPGRQKAEAVRRTLLGEISEQCPASILRRHPQACLYLDSDSAKEI